MALRGLIGLRPTFRTLARATVSGLQSHHVSRFATATKGTEGPVEQNHRARLELAAAYRIFERMDLNEGICNHLSLMAPAKNGSGDEVMLIIPYGLHWKEVTASSLLGISSKGEVVEGHGESEISAFHIHLGIRSKFNHKCVLHIHPPYSTALGCLKDPTIKMCHQTAMRFRGKIAYDLKFGGYGDNEIEGRRLADKLGDKEILMMGNHGILSAMPSVAEGLDVLYYFERLARIQLLAMSTGQELSLLTDEAYETSKPYMFAFPKYAKAHFDSHIRILEKECPEFAD